jgi:hypothetical protein
MWKEKAVAREKPRRTRVSIIGLRVDIELTLVLI